MIPDQDEPSAEIAALCALVAPTLERDYAVHSERK